jgi:hypothetical protein
MDRIDGYSAASWNDWLTGPGEDFLSTSGLAAAQTSVQPAGSAPVPQGPIVIVRPPPDYYPIGQAGRGIEPGSADDPKIYNTVTVTGQRRSAVVEEEPDHAAILEQARIDALRSAAASRGYSDLQADPKLAAQVAASVAASELVDLLSRREGFPLTAAEKEQAAALADTMRAALEKAGASPSQSLAKVMGLFDALGFSIRRIADGLATNPTAGTGTVTVAQKLKWEITGDGSSATGGEYQVAGGWGQFFDFRSESTRRADTQRLLLASATTIEIQVPPNATQAQINAIAAALAIDYAKRIGLVGSTERHNKEFGAVIHQENGRLYLTWIQITETTAPATALARAVAELWDNKVLWTIHNHPFDSRASPKDLYNMGVLRDIYPSFQGSVIGLPGGNPGYILWPRERIPDTPPFPPN